MKVLISYDTKMYSDRTKIIHLDTESQKQEFNELYNSSEKAWLLVAWCGRFIDNAKRIINVEVI